MSLFTRTHTHIYEYVITPTKSIFKVPRHTSEEAFGDPYWHHLWWVYMNLSVEHAEHSERYKIFRTKGFIMQGSDRKCKEVNQESMQ